MYCALRSVVRAPRGHAPHLSAARVALVSSKPRPVKRLATALRDLSMFHTETLDDMDRELIDIVHAITGYDT